MQLQDRSLGGIEVDAGQQRPPSHLPALDAARFICAFVVVMAHTGQPPLRDGIDTSHPIGYLLHGFIGNATSSAAAVICFFVISGIVIHYPNVAENRIHSPLSFFARRYVRIVVPVLFAIIFAQAMGVTLSLFNGTILWSLAAELIYYTLYPLLLVVRRQLSSWLSLIVVAYLAALVLVLTAPGTKDYPAFGLAWTWLLGLPCWLLGCHVAEKLAESRTWGQPVRWIWGVRLAVFLAAAACSVLRYHAAIGYPWTLNVFAMIAALWLYCEVKNGAVRPLPAFLTLAGAWSYSLYIFHKPTAALFDAVWTLELGPVLAWLWRVGVILVVAYAAYRLIERPSHQAARVLARAIDARVGRGKRVQQVEP